MELARVELRKKFWQKKEMIVFIGIFNEEQSKPLCIFERLERFVFDRYFFCITSDYFRAFKSCTIPLSFC